MKLETYFRLTGLPYEVIKGDHVFRAPKRKLPFIDDNGQIIADSSIIIQHLKTRYNDQLDDHLDATDRAVAHAFQRMFEESLYWPTLYGRWLDDRNWSWMRGLFFGKLPPVVRQLVQTLAQRKLRRDCVGQGMGHHTPEQIYAFGCKDIDAVVAFLGDKPFFMGNQPCTLDATVFGFLANLLWTPVKSPVIDHARQYPQLNAYCHRMWARCFADRPLPDHAYQAVAQS
ncbi:glutathione S-transferase [Chitinivorax tropicus]|uniref:Glutathione S-transferase n=2 Tax=Chitinivorax tropicus TaxID=714531 RepID=A0A840MS64_9PROT|nr:glutathione S-transferase [Chitinivorax tropicus]